MAQRGGFRPGSGRKSNVQKLMEAKFAAKFFTPSFQETKWKQLLASKDERVQVRAMEYLTDRFYGKPVQAIQGTGEEGALEVVVRHIGSDIKKVIACGNA